MKRIGLTQRVTYIERYHERRDSLDQRWWGLINQLGFMPIPLPNLSAENAADYARSLNLDGIIITGGNSLPPDASDAAPERDAFETALITWALQEERPIIGICRGMQIINQYFGGILSPVQNHVAVRHVIEFCGHWQQFNAREVNSYHNWGIQLEHLGHDLYVTARHTDDSSRQTIEAFQHLQKKVAGIMWHPERVAPYDPADIDLLRNLL
ncbi:MAG: gamma-glutamyl-gamma-aminobutyrate hydrolase family protein [Gammaproteobacteria bacterium]